MDSDLIFFFSYLLLGNIFVGRNRIAESYNGCYSNNSSAGGNYWQFWKAENKGYKGNKVTVKVQNMFSNLYVLFKFMKNLNYWFIFELQLPFSGILY